MTEQQENTLNHLLSMVQDLEASAASDGANDYHASIKTERLYEDLAIALRQALEVQPQAALAEKDAEIYRLNGEVESWYSQNQQHIQDAVDFAAERDVLRQALEAQEAPVARVDSCYGGYPTIQVLDPAVVLPTGAALYMRPQQARPGFALVPVKPTQAMWAAGYAESTQGGGIQDLQEAWQAMLAAAPKPALKGGGLENES